jgi:hypothetical protein
MATKLNVVHLFNYFKGSRYPAMISQGLRAHPAIEPHYLMPFVTLGSIVCPALKRLEETLREADLIFRADDEHFGFPEVDGLLDRHGLWRKVVYYDYKDSPKVDKHRLGSTLAYIKRSWGVGKDRQPRAPLPVPMLPMDYGLIDEYFAVPFPDTKDIDVACMFPPHPMIGERRYGLCREIAKAGARLGTVRLGRVTTGAHIGRRAIFEPPENNPFLDYLRILKRSKIVFTAFPDEQDGDSRTWEAFSCKALVFMDATGIPTAHPFENGRHCIVYDARDPRSIRDAIALAEYYLHNDRAREKIAEAGFRNAVNHHKPTDRIDRILHWVRDERKNLHDHVTITLQGPWLEPPLAYGFPAMIDPARPRPSFLGIGAQKAGTTWIDRNLRRHPALHLPPGVKELHFFDCDYHRGIGWYLNHFRDGAGKVCGEITPAYAMLKDGEVEQIIRLLPELKAFFVLRNPVERTWSAARMDLERLVAGRFPLERIPEELLVSYIQGFGVRARSDYMGTIRRWQRFLPHERLLLLNYDHLTEEPEAFLRTILRFLEVDDTVDPRRFALDERVLAGTEFAMPDRIRKLLCNLYEDRIVELQRFLGWDLSHWLSPPSSHAKTQAT